MHSCATALVVALPAWLSRKPMVAEVEFSIENFSPMVWCLKADHF